MYVAVELFDFLIYIFIYAFGFGLYLGVCEDK